MQVKFAVFICLEIRYNLTVLGKAGTQMKGIMESELGEIVVDSSVIATYAGSVAVECFGIIGMAARSMKDGLVRLVYKGDLKHGIRVSIVENEIHLTFHVIVAYGVSIQTIADNLFENVKYKVEQFTGLTVRHINLLVEGVREID